MTPKSTKGKGVAKDAGEKEAPESELAAQRTQFAYFPSTVDVVHLRDNFKTLRGCKMGGETMGHPATRIIPVDFAKAGPNCTHSSSTTFPAASAPLSAISSTMSCTPMASTF